VPILPLSSSPCWKGGIAAPRFMPAIVEWASVVVTAVTRLTSTVRTEADGGGDPDRGTDGGGDPDGGRWRWRRCGRGPSDPDPVLGVVAIVIEPGWKHWNLFTRRGGTMRGLPLVVPMEEEKNREGAHWRSIWGVRAPARCKLREEVRAPARKEGDAA
jgi:hypothetical protein